jgi:hypothetical protein
LLGNPEEQKRLADLAFEKSNQYRWGDTAERTWQAIAALGANQI